MEGLEGNIGHQRLEDLLGQEAVKMGQTILLIQVRLELLHGKIYSVMFVRSRQEKDLVRLKSKPSRWIIISLFCSV